MRPTFVASPRSPLHLLLILAAATAAGCAGGGPEEGTVAPLSVACPSSVPAWASGTSYSVGAIVTYNGTTISAGRRTRR